MNTIKHFLIKFRIGIIEIVSVGLAIITTFAAMGIAVGIVWIAYKLSK